MEIDFKRMASMSDDQIMKELMSNKRDWASDLAKMYLIFALGRQDVLPYEDVAFLQAFTWLYGIRRSPEVK